MCNVCGSSGSRTASSGEAPTRHSQQSRRFSPQCCPSHTRGGSLPVAPAGTNMGRMTNHFSSCSRRAATQNYETNPRPPIPLSAAQPVPKITKRTQGLCPRRRKVSLLIYGKTTSNARRGTHTGSPFSPNEPERSAHSDAAASPTGRHAIRDGLLHSPNIR
jgi:hypothetical protein